MFRPIIAAAIVALTIGWPAAFAQQLGGYTHLLHDSAHGTQVEYLGGNGKTYLWYPGNAVILAGSWKRQGEDICFAYGENTYNPATGHKGGGWECMPFWLYWGAIWERMPGDIFALADRTEAPFRLTKPRTTLERLLSRVAPGARPPAVEYTMNTPAGQISQNCELILANADRSISDKQAAASLYFHGMFMGKRCIDVDYDKAFAIARETGMDVEPWLRVLRERAADGHLRAIAALERLGP